MSKCFKTILDAFRIPSIEDREYRYLSGAFSCENLEYRQREVDNGLFRKGR